MIFNSLAFVVFLVVVFAMHWLPLSRSRRHQNVVLLIASYVFYGWWDPRFLTLLLFSSLVDHFIGLKIAATEDERLRRTYLWISMSTNLGLLFFFKYFNFFVGSFKEAFGLPEAASTLDIILPVGISFYTFQTMSYTIDVYRRQMEPSRNIIEFLTFVSFFPQLVAGPIERARTLLPQIAKRRVFSYDQGVSGCRMILIGAFKKMVVADRIGPMVDVIFAEGPGGWANVLGVVLFAFQIYCDFSGYSDMAIGTARLFGVELMRNFDRPYFSRDVGEFWRRWHISLSTWFRDYVYIPLGGSRGDRLMVIRNVSIVFLVSGLWHGANWTFVIWGAIHAMLFLPLILLHQNKKNDRARVRFFPSGRDLLSMIFTFCLVCVAWIFFRAADIDHAIRYLFGLFDPDANVIDDLRKVLRGLERTPLTLLIDLALIGMLLFFDRLTMIPAWRERILHRPALRYTGYAVLTATILLFGVFTDTRAFIYFQF